MPTEDMAPDDLRWVREKFRNAVRSLATSAKTIQERLATAYASDLNREREHLTAGLTPELAMAVNEVLEALEDRSRVLAMTDSDATELAGRIASMAARLDDEFAAAKKRQAEPR